MDKTDRSLLEYAWLIFIMLGLRIFAVPLEVIQIMFLAVIIVEIRNVIRELEKR